MDGAFTEWPELWIRVHDEADGDHDYPIRLRGSNGITELRKALDAIEQRFVEAEQQCWDQPGYEKHSTQRSMPRWSADSD